jgi:broad specificity phosphatase PhoE
MSTLFWVARHGTTDDTKKKIFRGDRNSQLDQKGFVDAHDLKKFFSDLPWSHGVISTMDRSHQTMYVIADGDEDRILGPFDDLNPWDIGYLAGKDRADYEADMQVFVDHPNMRPQGGETLQEFRDRIVPIFMTLIEMGLRGDHNVLIGHSSVIHVLEDLLGGKIDVKPGGVIEVYVDKKGDIKARAIYKSGDDDSSFSGTQASS